MLLQHFTWQQFLIAATILTAVWYVVVILIFYRQKLQDILNGKQHQDSTPERLKHAWEDDYENESDDEADDLIGKSLLPEGMSKVSMSMFGFAPKTDEVQSEPATVAIQSNNEQMGPFAEDEHKSREKQQTLVPDAIEELKTIFHILEKDKGGKEYFISLFNLIKNKYSSLCNTPSEHALNEFIRENALFPISDKELTNLWR